MPWHWDSMKAGKTPWLPVWAERLQWLSYASFIPFAALVVIGVWEHRFLTMAVFALFALPIFVRTCFKAHAVARGEITWFPEQNRHIE
jgi:hypothetical protein